MGGDSGEQRTPDEPPGTTPGLEDHSFRALANARRRRLLYVLLEEGETTVDEMATLLSGWTAVDSGEMTTPEERERHRVRLYHADLPILSEAGLVDVDRERDTLDVATVDDALADLVRRSVDPTPVS